MDDSQTDSVKFTPQWLSLSNVNSNNQHFSSADFNENVNISRTRGQSIRDRHDRNRYPGKNFQFSKCASSSRSPPKLNRSKSFSSIRLNGESSPEPRVTPQVKERHTERDYKFLLLSAQKKSKSTSMLFPVGSVNQPKPKTKRDGLIVTPSKTHPRVSIPAPPPAISITNSASANHQTPSQSVSFEQRNEVRSPPLNSRSIPKSRPDMFAVELLRGNSHLQSKPVPSSSPKQMPFPFKKTTSEPILPLPKNRGEPLVNGLHQDDINTKVSQNPGRTRRPTDVNISQSVLTRNSFFQGLRKKQEEQEKGQNNRLRDELEEFYGSSISKSFETENRTSIDPKSQQNSHVDIIGGPDGYALENISGTPPRTLLASQEDEERLLRSLGWSPTEEADESEEWISEEEKESIRKQVLQNRLKIIQSRKSRELSLNSSITNWQKKLFFSEQIGPETESSSSEPEE